MLSWRTIFATLVVLHWNWFTARAVPTTHQRHWMAMVSESNQAEIHQQIISTYEQFGHSIGVDDIRKFPLHDVHLFAFPPSNAQVWQQLQSNPLLLSLSETAPTSHEQMWTFPTPVIKQYAGVQKGELPEQCRQGTSTSNVSKNIWERPICAYHQAMVTSRVEYNGQASTFYEPKNAGEGTSAYLIILCQCQHHKLVTPLQPLFVYF
jgi:hypothetical protein